MRLKQATNRRRKQPGIPMARLILLVWVIFTSALLLLSIAFRKDPLSLVQDTIYIITNLDQKWPSNIKLLKREIIEKDYVIDSLEQIAQKFENTFSTQIAEFKDKQGIINMRSLPDINSDVIIKIAANEKVEILYYDTELKTIQGENGRWVKVRYLDNEGWVWSGLLSVELE